MVCDPHQISLDITLYFRLSIQIIYIHNNNNKNDNHHHNHTHNHNNKHINNNNNNNNSNRDNDNNNNRKKFRSQTSDNMDRWKSRAGKSQRGEEQKREDQRRERVRRKKMQVPEKVEKSRNTVFFQWFVSGNRGISRAWLAVYQDVPVAWNTSHVRSYPNGIALTRLPCHDWILYRDCLWHIWGALVNFRLLQAQIRAWVFDSHASLSTGDVQQKQKPQEPPANRRRTLPFSTAEPLNLGSGHAVEEAWWCPDMKWL